MVTIYSVFPGIMEVADLGYTYHIAANFLCYHAQPFYPTQRNPRYNE